MVPGLASLRLGRRSEGGLHRRFPGAAALLAGLSLLACAAPLSGSAPQSPVDPGQSQTSEVSDASEAPVAPPEEATTEGASGPNATPEEAIGIEDRQIDYSLLARKLDVSTPAGTATVAKSVQEAKSAWPGVEVTDVDFSERTLLGVVVYTARCLNDLAGVRVQDRNLVIDLAPHPGPCRTSRVSSLYVLSVPAHDLTGPYLLTAEGAVEQPWSQTVIL